MLVKSTPVQFSGNVFLPTLVVVVVAVAAVVVVLFFPVT
jgi:hypothetical protein